ncbi:hypothetical protein F5884DRAFT_117157 [Xylogone sp. PMI_703]|nr:hypothetical protein F5884DRAFT_117157 [Xylogone sp. PMI_703]
MRKDMAGARYHILPEEGRPSTDSMADDSERLLGPINISSPSTPKKPFTISYHPTFILRVIIVALLVTTFALYITSRNGFAIPAIIFLGIAIARNVLVLLGHFGEFVKIRINVEIVGREVGAGGRCREARKKFRGLGKRSIQLAIDALLIIILTITSAVTFSNIDHWWYYGGYVVPGSITCWVALPLYAVAAIDMGKPSRILFTTTMSLNLGKEKDDRSARPAPQPETYRDGDLESSIIAVDEEETRDSVPSKKTRDESP